jgi:hypothetical protein
MLFDAGRYADGFDLNLIVSKTPRLGDFMSEQRAT